MVLPWQLSTHIHGREEKKRLEIGITQKYIRLGTNWDVYKQASIILFETRVVMFKPLPLNPPLLLLH
jgi:hypothetical protein